MDIEAFRDYLAEDARQSSAEVAADAFRDGHPGAVSLVTLVLALRVNRRSRKTFAKAQAAYGAARRPRWVKLLIEVVWNFYRVSLDQSTPSIMSPQFPDVLDFKPEFTFLITLQT